MVFFILRKFKEGDTIELILPKFKISSQTLVGLIIHPRDAVEPNKTLVVPLVDGVVYTVKDGVIRSSSGRK